ISSFSTNSRSLALTSSRSMRLPRPVVIARPAPHVRCDPVYRESRVTQEDAPKTQTASISAGRAVVQGGGGGIRTHGRANPTTVFETAPINHSGTPPLGLFSCLSARHFWP